VESGIAGTEAKDHEEVLRNETGLEKKGVALGATRVTEAGIPNGPPGRGRT